MVFGRTQWILNVVVALFFDCLVGGLVVVAVAVLYVATVAPAMTWELNWMRNRTGCANVMIWWSVVMVIQCCITMTFLQSLKHVLGERSRFNVNTRCTWCEFGCSGQIGVLRSSEVSLL